MYVCLSVWICVCVCVYVCVCVCVSDVLLLFVPLHLLFCFVMSLDGWMDALPFNLFCILLLLFITVCESNIETHYCFGNTVVWCGNISVLSLVYYIVLHCLCIILHFFGGRGKFQGCRRL